jgi:hypothetical protein
MAEVADFARLAGREQGLSVVATVRADQTIQATVVNCGVLDHPVRGVPVIGFTTRGNSRKLANLYDRVMAEERRTAVLITPERVYSNR